MKNQNNSNIKPLPANDGAKRGAINPEKYMKPIKPITPPKKEK